MGWLFVFKLPIAPAIAGGKTLPFCGIFATNDDDFVVLYHFAGEQYTAIIADLGIKVILKTKDFVGGVGGVADVDIGHRANRGIDALLAINKVQLFIVDVFIVVADNDGH
jgi:hypothetical protein